jgi:transcriptional regulator with XRE-family HTH domain
MERETFGNFLRKKRLEAGYGLRAFAMVIDMQPSNLSNIERGKIPPPQDSERLEQIARALDIEENSGDWARLFDLAVAHKEGAVPADVAEYAAKTEGVPVLLRTAKNRQLSEDEFKQLTDYIRKHF